MWPGERDGSARASLRSSVWVRRDGWCHAWCCDEGAGEYVDVAGFCRAAPLVEIRTQGHILTPGRYVGTAAADEDDEPFEESMHRLTVTLFAQQTDAAELDAAISPT